MCLAGPNIVPEGEFPQVRVPDLEKFSETNAVNVEAGHSSVYVAELYLCI